MAEGGGEPEGFAQCDDCGEIYPAQRGPDGVRPIGTNGQCQCGSTTFRYTDSTDHHSQP